MEGKMAAETIIILDDVADVRQLLTEFLEEAGFEVVAVATAEELLKELRDAPVAVACLDLQLRHDRTVADTLSTFKELFPGVDLPDDEVRADWGLSSKSEVTGAYLLPMVKRVSPETEVLMVTSNWVETDEGLLQKWGSYVTIQKCAPDTAFKNHNKVFGLDDELVTFINQVLERRGRRIA
jgi:CheY-like chemotaxis protein